MRSRRPLALLAMILLLGVVASAMAAPGASLDGPARVPAPPPSSCRLAPTNIWASLLAPAVVPDLVAYQDYRQGLALTGTSTGKGVRIADVEYEWLASHVELAAKNLPQAAPAPLPPAYQARDHGTAVLGVLGATADGKGITGLAPDATLLPTSPFIAGAYRPAQAIASAAAGLGPGDVLLVELQAQVPTQGGGGPMVPIEAYPEVRAAIRDAVGRGIVVVEPAANSGLDLGAVSLGDLGPNPWAPGTPGHDDSGALLVGGGGSGSTLLDGSVAGDLQRTPESNYGARVDLQGYGAGVVTSGYADLPGAAADSSYTACFDGTSSASATVAGAVAAVQGEAIARFGSPLTPAQMRTLLATTGRPQVMAGPADGAIGPRPQVGAAVDGIAAVRDEVPAIAPSLPRTGDTTPTPAAPVAGSPAPVAVRTPVAARASATLAVAAALRTPVARLDRRSSRLTVTLRDLAPSARITVDGRRVTLVRGVLTLRATRSRTFVVRITAPSRAGTRYLPARFTITVPRSGAPRVARSR